MPTHFDQNLVTTFMTETGQIRVVILQLTLASQEHRSPKSVVKGVFLP